MFENLVKNTPLFIALIVIAVLVVALIVFVIVKVVKNKKSAKQEPVKAEQKSEDPAATRNRAPASGRS